ncbi:MAG: TRZ/ATZ family hydrolase [Wenzhouxiangellaceae bacterium]|nr:TRZ/ATZ family hydrolase [Wenzhouxiangellaceae bacterium]
MTTARRQILLPRWLVPVAPEGAILERTGVLVEDGEILDLVPFDEIDARAAGAERVELDRHALIPGLVNMHTHSAMALLRGIADDLPLMRWLEDHIWPAESAIMGPSYVRAGSRLAVAEMLAGGTTCFNDNYFFPDVTAEVAIEAGMRGVVGMPMIRFPTAWAETEDDYLRRGLEVHQALVDEPLISTSFVPHAPYSVSDSAFERIRTLAEELDISVHLHLLEAAGEIESSRGEYGLHPLDRLDRLGLLGPRLLAVHMTQIDDDDIARLARRGVHVLHCPESNLKLASGLCPVAKLDSAGVNVCIGTDGAASNNDLDMFGEMRTTALLAKGVSGDPEAVPAARALSMATLHGARALGLDDRIGSVEPGKRADLAAVRLDALATTPVHNVISQLVYSAHAGMVSDVWVDGRRVKSGGTLTTVDVHEVRAEAETWRRRITESS